MHLGGDVKWEMRPIRIDMTQEAEEILKKCDEIESSVQRLREVAKQVLKSTAKVVPIRGKFP